MVDSCASMLTDKDSIKKMLHKNFDNFYEKKVPMPLFWHYAYFSNQHQKPFRAEAFLEFIDEILKKKDVFFVTMQELIQWTKNPKTLEQIKQKNDFGCQFNERPGKCNISNTVKCVQDWEGQERHWSSCQIKSCPKFFPTFPNFGY